jgi:S1-C subfamily serine protease
MIEESFLPRWLELTLSQILAVLKIKGKNLPKVSIGDSENLKVGDWVVAIGSPFLI